MLRLLKHEVSNYFANMAYIHIYNHLTNQLINQSTISVLNPDQASAAGKFPEAVDPDCKRTGSDHPLSKAVSMPVVEKVIE
jgi:hypothetical protein